MATQLAATLTSLDSLPEEHRAFYAQATEGEGPFVLQVKPVDGYSLEDVAGLKKVLSEVKGDREKLKAKLEAFKDLDPDKAREALGKLDEMKNWTPEDKVREQIESQVSQVKEKFAKEVETSKKSQTELTKQIEKLLIDNAARGALQKFQLVEGGADLLMPHIRSQMRVEKGEDGNFVARVVNPDGTVRISMAPNSTDPMEVNELVEGMRDIKTFAPAYAGTGASGTGASGSQDKTSSPANLADIKDPSARLAEVRRQQGT